MRGAEMSDDKPDISKPIAEICDALGLVPGNVARLDMYPKCITAEVYRLNENGSKYIGEDGAVAKDTQEFEVVT
jgi:hypothetical protein